MDNNFSAIYDIPYGDHERHKVDIFLPKNVKSDSGLILYIHGGGWHCGDKFGHYDDTKHFSNLGYICATMNYRFVSEDISVSDELDDITAALKAVKTECAKYGFNTEKLILSGGSAGAHLALLYAYTRKDEAPVTPVAVCVYCPPVDCEKSDFLLGISGEYEDWKYEIMSKCCGFRVSKNDFQNEPQQNALKKISPIQYISENCVPTAVFHGKKDELIPLDHIYNFISMLDDAGVRNDLLLFENCGHTLDKDLETLFQSRDIIEDYAERYFCCTEEPIMNNENKFDELRFFAEVKKRPGMFLGKTSLISLRDYYFGMQHAFDICTGENQFRYFSLFVDWYFENVVRDKNGYACWWNHLLYISGNYDDLAFHNFFREFEKYLKDFHDLCLPEVK